MTHRTSLEVQACGQALKNAKTVIFNGSGRWARRAPARACRDKMLFVVSLVVATSSHDEGICNSYGLSRRKTNESKSLLGLHGTPQMSIQKTIAKMNG